MSATQVATCHATIVAPKNAIVDRLPRRQKDGSAIAAPRVIVSPSGPCESLIPKLVRAHRHHVSQTAAKYGRDIGRSKSNRNADHGPAKAGSTPEGPPRCSPTRRKPHHGC